MTTSHATPLTVTRHEGHQVYFPPPLPTIPPPFDSRTTSLPSPYLEETNEHDTTAMQPPKESSLQLAVGYGDLGEENTFPDDSRKDELYLEDRVLNYFTCGTCR